MTRPWLVAYLLLAACPLAQSAVPGLSLEQAREQFLHHEQGQPTLAGADFQAAREVQEGCEEPCTQPEAVAAYLKKVEAAASRLKLSGVELDKARQHYAPKGIPRKKSALQVAPGKTAGSAAEARIRPELGARLQAAALDMAAALGQTRFVSSDGGVVMAARTGPAAPQWKAAPKREGPVIRAAPLDPSQVDQRLHQALDAEVNKRPTGRRLLASMKNPPRVVLEKLDSPDTIAQHDGKKISINTMRVSDVIISLDPAAAKAGDLTDPGALRRYLAAHTDLLPKVAQAFDTWYVHEMTHAAQKSRNGGWFGNWKSGWVDILNGMKYPVEMEYEAFGTQNRYFGEKAAADPSVLRMNGPFPSTVIDYTDYIDNLVKYRKGILSTYQGDVDSIDKLRLHSQKEKDYYRATLAQEQREWDRRSVDGHILVARCYNGQGYHVMGLQNLKTAFDRAAAGKFIDAVRPDIAKTFQETLAGIEARLAKAEADKKPWQIGALACTLIKQLSADLKVALPPRVAKAVK